MATSKGTKATKKRAPATSGHPTDTVVDDGGAFVRKCLAELAALSPAEKRAFSKQCTDAVATALGARTKAINVLHDSERFAGVIHAALAAPAGGLSYGSSRFRQLLELTDALRTSIAADGTKLAQTGAVQTGVDEAHRKALSVRERLVEKLSAFATGNATREKAVSDALFDTKTDDLVMESLKALAKLARDWLALTGEEDVALAKSVHLDETSAADADAARGALAAAHGDGIGAGAKVVRDSPATNLIEGRVLFEMRYAMHLFEGAHGRDATSPRLVPGPGTRPVLAPSRSTGTAVPAAEAGAPKT